MVVGMVVVKDQVIRDNLLQGNNAVVIDSHGSEVEVVQDHLAYFEEVKDHLVDRDLEKVSCKMFNASSTRILVITNHIVGLKGRTLIKELVLLVIRL